MPRTEIVNLHDFDRNTPMVIETSDQEIRASVADVIQWIAPGAPPAEALKFLITCRSARLNPFLNEAYLVQMGAKWGTIVAKAGYLKRAEEHPDFDGYEAGIVVQAFHPRTMERHGPLVEQPGEIVPGGFLLVGGWARAWKRGRSRPYHRQVALSEYSKDNHIWKSIPCTMIRKVALVGVIREAFALSDAFDDSEVEPIARNPAVPAEVVARAAAAPPRLQFEAAVAVASDPAAESLYRHAPDPHLAPDQVARILGLVEATGMPASKFDAYLRNRGAGAVADLSPTEAASLIAKLAEVESRMVVVGSFPAVVDRPSPPVSCLDGMPLDAHAAPVAAGGHAEIPVDNLD